MLFLHGVSEEQVEQEEQQEQEQQEQQEEQEVHKQKICQMRCGMSP